MKANPSLLDIVAKGYLMGYLMGWIKPPPRQPDKDQAYKIHQSKLDAERYDRIGKKPEPKPVA